MEQQAPHHGPDGPANMQWLTRQEHREKTRLDVMRCRLESNSWNRR